MSARNQEIQVLKARLLTRFQEINPSAIIENSCPIIIAGEYIGSKVQKGVAIAKLSPRFVIISIAINGIWQPDEEYADIYDEAAGIYNISRGGFYKKTINLIDTERSLAELYALTIQVEKECPFAMSFGISGPGEGIVWKFEKYPHAPTTWFKIKPEEFPTTSSKAIIPQEVVDQRKKLAGFAKWVVRERRLEQGLEFLAEMHIPRSKPNVSKFLEWVVRDVLIEEKWTMKQHGITSDALRPEINRIGTGWYYRSVKEDEGTVTNATIDHVAMEPKPDVKLEASTSFATIVKRDTVLKTESSTKFINFIEASRFADSRLYALDSDSDEDEGGVPLTASDMPLRMNALPGSCSPSPAHTMQSSVVVEEIATETHVELSLKDKEEIDGL